MLGLIALDGIYIVFLNSLASSALQNTNVNLPIVGKWSKSKADESPASVL